MEKLIDITDFGNKEKHNSSTSQVKNISKKDIAVIGAAGRFGCAENLEEFWSGLKAGRDFIRSLPDNRKADSEIYRRASSADGQSGEGIRYREAAYMDRIDAFDSSIFRIPPREADLTDPNQRQMLEVIWECIEDAGYGGEKIRGSRTGVFVGYSSDFSEEYKNYIRTVTNDQEEVSITGNLKSIIAGRIAYILDLKGPAMMIDTACSSSLVAVHLACRSLRNGECSMAVAGGVKLLITAPAETAGQGNAGILSPTGRARTFDDSSDGTGLGEGVGAVLLKPLSKAVEDGDPIYAVIKGSAVNQDGDSIGITAPNMVAQEDVILRAWNDADIDPETVSYIETHGTATRLGDPIEVTAIRKAFENFTNKKQFCAVASVKSNIGHLDHTAGIAAVLKAVMAIKHGELPPSLHFQKPNRKIAFEDSPVYINDKLAKWESNGPRRCGISSFGLSGTNCHLILEEYTAADSPKRREEDIAAEEHILTLSAGSSEALMSLLKRYDDFLPKCSPDEFAHICHTAGTGREHFNIRLAVVAGSLEDLRSKIKFLVQDGIKKTALTDIFHGEHKIVASSKRTKLEGEITEEEKKQLSSQAAANMDTLCESGAKERLDGLRKLGRLYVQGADVEWKGLYSPGKYKRLNLPVYQFLKERHWINVQIKNTSLVHQGNRSLGQPLIDTCLAESMDIRIYSTRFSAEKHWVLGEHKVAGDYVIPGTTYIEMICELAYQKDQPGVVEFKDVLFLTPVALKGGSEAEVQIILRKDGNCNEFAFVTRAGEDGSFIRHVEGKFEVKGEAKPPLYDIDGCKQRLQILEHFQYGEDADYAVEIGPRFKNLTEIYMGDGEVLAYLSLPQEYSGDLLDFKMHPALMDTAVNMANSAIGDGFYLPLSYQSLTIYGNMPGKFYCHLVRKNKETSSLETGVFDILLIEESGKIFAVIEGYTVKKVHSPKTGMFMPDSPDFGFYETRWIESVAPKPTEGLNAGAVLVFKDKSDVSSALITRLKETGCDLYEIEMGESFEMTEQHKFIISGTEEDYHKVFGKVSSKISTVVHMMSICGGKNINSVEELEDSSKNGVYSLFCLAKAVMKFKINPLDLILVSDNTSMVTGKEHYINPQGAAMFALGRVAENEYSGLRCKCIDLGEGTSAAEIVNEMAAADKGSYAAYRNGKRYVEEFGKASLTGGKEEEIDIKSEGVYIITGGAGGLGLEIAGYLASKNKVRLCLINRSALPERSEWEHIQKRNDDTKLCKKITAIRRIEESGSEVLCYNADVSDFQTMETIIKELVEKYGGINGVIHAAGVAGDGYLIRKPADVFRQVILPKINGTWVLDKLTENLKLDFFILFSSISGYTFTPGQGDYTAANTYLDVFARYRDRKGKRTLSINWPAWKETGMAVDHNALNNESFFKPISTADACKAFELLLDKRIVRVLPAELNYKIFEGADVKIPFVLSEEIRRKAGKKKNGNDKPVQQNITEQKGAKVILKGKLGNGYSETEQWLGRLWSLVLGVTEVDVYDNFESLGGDSLLATNLLKEMQKTYGNLVDISDIFTYSSIFDMAEYIESKTNKKKELEKIEEEEEDIQEDRLNDILDQLASGKLSLEEAGELIDLGAEE
ncbi:MAG TPA: SDR family NAD(P)-dependent oxidoreductase [Ruminiclostridium sp.]|nr:SDR family NAD(P)-dependent oxidoreductase [Ruminiclostridium sp.]